MAEAEGTEVGEGDKEVKEGDEEQGGNKEAQIEAGASGEDNQRETKGDEQTEEFDCNQATQTVGEKQGSKGITFDGTRGLESESRSEDIKSEGEGEDEKREQEGGRKGTGTQGEHTHRLEQKREASRQKV